MNSVTAWVTTPHTPKASPSAVEGEFTIKRLEKRGSAYWLVPDNPNHNSTDISAR